MDFIADARAAPFTGIAGEVPRYTFLDVHRFTDIDNVTARIMEVVHATLGRKLVKHFLGKVGRKDCLAGVPLQRTQNMVLVIPSEQLIKYLNRCSRVSAGAMAVGNFNAQTLRQATQT